MPNAILFSNDITEQRFVVVVATDLHQSLRVDILSDLLERNLCEIVNF